MKLKRHLAIACAVLLLLQLPAVPPATASTLRTLQQWYGPGYGPGWGNWGGSWYGRPPYDPVGSGCYHPESLIRYRSGQTAYCKNGNRLRCNWGNWEGSCKSYGGGGSDWGWRKLF